jgi:hypothetical protein
MQLDGRHTIADDWTAVSEVLYDAGETEDRDEFRDLLAKVSDQVAAIVDAEEQFYADVFDQLA